MNIQVVRTIDELSSTLSVLKSKGKTIGFVPTMGALHEGHISLVNKAKLVASVVVSSIYVNKSQFNESSDFDNYPRTLDQDIAKLNEADCNIVFVPSQQEMDAIPLYDSFDISEFDLYMEGKHRPGHFNGVANVVYRFLNIIQPDFAVFGEKDYMQCVLIKKLATTFFENTEIIIAVTKREENGLAMSSRNTRLSPKSITNSLVLSQLMNQLKKDVSSFSDYADFKKWKSDIKTGLTGVEMEYFELVENGMIKPAEKINDKVSLRCCICAKVEGVRLIDNMLLN